MVAALYAGAASDASAQVAPRDFASVAELTPTRYAERRTIALDGVLGNGAKDYRYTGFYVGLGVGVGLGIYALAECTGRECAVRPVPFAIASTVVFSVVGALIGGLIPK
jgi:hypothetical protein